MTQDSLRAALETLDGLATAVIAMKLAIPIGRPLGPEWQAFLARTGDVNRWLDENDRVQGRAALASPDTGVVEGAGLDVERLARAMCETMKRRHGGNMPNCMVKEGPWTATHRAEAQAIAAEYARLATPAPEEAPE